MANLALLVQPVLLNACHIGGRAEKVAGRKWEWTPRFRRLSTEHSERQHPVTGSIVQIEKVLRPPPCSSFLSFHPTTLTFRASAANFIASHSTQRCLNLNVTSAKAKALHQKGSFALAVMGRERIKCSVRSGQFIFIFTLTAKNPQLNLRSSPDRTKSWIRRRQGVIQRVWGT